MKIIIFIIYLGSFLDQKIVIHKALMIRENVDLVQLISIQIR